ncbi:deoxyribodipyrimidine photo-lyase [Vibrio xiamenensis]|uniref:Deoxyribodipyrimidine photo-lyase n=1 Tax=Vibrio xiamenensis TaxID=861298 RepID=A0A1G8AG54_9VIBR|nr:deoxyribodipyrimidine photo-lyase [Vibrio xiamenensis]SDH19881.1 deoxyribodipyrimidine photo-lyase [Vibrio xiamenensis]
MKLVWLRRDLRVDDNSALIAALNSNEPVAAVFIATPAQWQQHHLAPIQADLIWRRLAELSGELEALNVPLLYRQVDRYGQAAQAVSELALELQANEVWVNRDYELNEQRRDALCEQLLEPHGVSFKSCHDKCALAPGEVKNQQGEYFKVFTPFKKAYLKLFYAQPLSVLKAPQGVSWPLPSSLESWRFSKQAAFDYPRQTSQAWPAKTTEIIALLREFCQQSADDYKLRRDFPAQAGTSKLSAYLAIGALSVRQCLARLSYGHDVLSEGRQVWQSELIWREFYQHLLWFEPKLSRGESFLNWGKRLAWQRSERHFDAWKQGQTGYPIVDAAMRQLNQTGWMHNRLRMIVASFLIKDLHISWRQGEDYFMSQLIDGDYAANNGGWQWCASTGCDGQPYFRIFNPITQGEKFDPEGEFVRHWVPELSEVPDKFLHQPWKWDGVKLLSYPAPIVDHKPEREITLQLYKEAKDGN